MSQMDVECEGFDYKISYEDHEELKNVKTCKFEMKQNQDVISESQYYVFNTDDIKLIYNYADRISEDIDNITHSLMDFHIHPEIQGSILIIDSMNIYNDQSHDSIDLVLESLNKICDHAKKDGSEIISLNSEKILFKNENFKRTDLSLSLRKAMYRPIKQEKYDFIFVKYLGENKKIRI